MEGRRWIWEAFGLGCGPEQGDGMSARTKSDGVPVRGAAEREDTHDRRLDGIECHL